MPDPAVKVDLSQIFEGVSKVKLRGGVVGKVSVVLICICASFAAIAWAAQSVWVCVLALVLVSAICCTMLWRLINFADKNPQAALLEGAEFLAHEKMRYGMKSSPVLPASNALPILPPKHIAIEEKATAALPDAVPPQTQ